MDLICGMHRSGTSLVARIAHRLGADLGEPEGFHAADKWNPDGYFEQREILAINMKLVSGPWGRAAYFRLPSEETIRARARSLAGKIEEVALRYRDRVVKENRFCLTLGAWRDHGARVNKLLVVFREPSGVARSLRKRNRIPSFLGIALWAEHHRRLFRLAEDIPTACLWYDRLVASEAGAGWESEKLAWLLGVQTRHVRDVVRELTRFRGRSPQPAVGHLSPPVMRLFSQLRDRSDQVP